jgi:hypothetical protein
LREKSFLRDLLSLIQDKNHFPAVEPAADKESLLFEEKVSNKGKGKK